MRDKDGDGLWGIWGGGAKFSGSTLGRLFSGGQWDAVGA